MKNYIKNVQSFKEDMSERRSKADIKHKASKLRSELFLGQEMKSSIAHLEEVFRVDVKVLKDDEIATKKADLPKELQKINKRRLINLLQFFRQISFFGCNFIIFQNFLIKDAGHFTGVFEFSS